MYIDITNNGVYIIRTDDDQIFEAFDTKEEMLDFLNDIFTDIESQMFPKDDDKNPPKNGRISTKS